MPAHAHPWEGRHLGDRTVAYDERDAILYALAVGARDIASEGLAGPQIGEALRKARIAAIAEARRAGD